MVGGAGLVAYMCQNIAAEDSIKVFEALGIFHRAELLDMAMLTQQKEATICSGLAVHKHLCSLTSKNDVVVAVFVDMHSWHVPSCNPPASLSGMSACRGQGFCGAAGHG